MTHASPDLRPTRFLDYEHASIQSFVRDAIAGAESDVERAKRLFVAVRDGVRYDAMLQPFDSRGRAFLEYLRDRGVYDDFPDDEMVRVWRETYPHMFAP